MSTYKPFKRAKNKDTPENNEKYYLKNSNLLPAVIRAKEQGKVTDELIKMLMTLARKYAQKPCFGSYSYKEDMISEATVSLCHSALKFDTEKYNNPFAYYTSCVHNSFLQYLNNEKRHRKIRDQLLIDLGDNPSYSFTEEYNHNTTETSEFKNEIVDLKNQINEAKERDAQETKDDALKAFMNKTNVSADTESSLTNFEYVEEVIEETIKQKSFFEFED